MSIPSNEQQLACQVSLLENVLRGIMQSCEECNFSKHVNSSLHLARIDLSFSLQLMLDELDKMDLLDKME